MSVLNDDLDTAYSVFSHIDSPRGIWGCSFVSVLKGYMSKFPTYFGIRNFFEIDLDFLLKNNKIDYVEQCLGALELFSTINQETYKFAARVMLENKLFTSALKYLDKSKETASWKKLLCLIGIFICAGTFIFTFYPFCAPKLLNINQ